MKPNQIILEGVTGSVAYGLNTESSDVDVKGIYILPTSNVLSLKFNPERTTVDHVEPDWVYHEVAKFMKLTANGNPTASELLWLNDYTVLEPIGKMLVENRNIFLSTKAVVNAYSGYAYGQCMKLAKRQNEGLDGYGSALKNRYEKHSRHLWRLMLQAKELLTDGKLTIKLTPKQREECFAFGKLKPNEVVDGFIEMDNEIRGLEKTSVLPDKPDWDKIDKLLYDIRRGNI